MEGPLAWGGGGNCLLCGQNEALQKVHQCHSVLRATLSACSPGTNESFCLWAHQRRTANGRTVTHDRAPPHSNHLEAYKKQQQPTRSLRNYWQPFKASGNLRPVVLHGLFGKVLLVMVSDVSGP